MSESEQKKETLLNPLQEAFLFAYMNPDSETFSNARQSALKAGYTETYANNITYLLPKWLLERMGDSDLLAKAEKNLEKAMRIDVTDEKIGDRALRASTFVAERLGKKRYSTKTETDVTSNGETLTIALSETIAKKLALGKE